MSRKVLSLFIAIGAEKFIARVCVCVEKCLARTRVMEAWVPATPEYNADTTLVCNWINLTLSKFLHEWWNKGMETDKSARVGSGCDKCLGISTLWVLSVRYLCSQLCNCNCCNTTPATTPLLYNHHCWNSRRVRCYRSLTVTQLNNTGMWN